ncbi:MAG: hypothetical protein AAB425_15450, partial [Bdellovibrionota bacterium]
DLISENKSTKDSVLVLTAPEVGPVIAIMAEQPSLRRIDVITGPPSAQDHQFTEELKERLNPFEIDISMAWDAPLDSRAHGRTAAVGPQLTREIPFFR